MDTGTTADKKLKINMINPELLARGEENLPKSWRVTKDLWLPPNEARNFHSIVQCFREHYRKGKTPYSIAVFGPPGAGKSHAVKELAKLAEGKLLEFNLSQFTAVKDLFAAFRLICHPLLKDELRIAFFDEFDTKLAGEPLGWLGVFLSPMQDGLFNDEGLPRNFGNCIFIFGGGTAATRDEFPEIHSPYFVNAKGPDFISRLEEKHIELHGINSDQKQVRRAVLIRTFLTGEQKKQIPTKILRKLLNAGRYRHGARSLKATLRIIARSSWRIPACSDVLYHVDGGELEGVKIALSAGGPASASRIVHKQLATSLVGRRARLMYGYDPLHYAEKDKSEKEWVNNYISGINEVLANRPQSLFGDDLTPIISLIPTGLRLPSKKTAGVVYSKLETISDHELKDLGIKKIKYPYASSLETWLNTQKAWALSLFRMRLSMMRDADAVIAMTGKEFGSSGRFPGVAEEVMLALAFSKPVYLLGAFGGAAKAVGNVMGLSKLWYRTPECLTENAQIERNKTLPMLEFLEWARAPHGAFALPFCPALPLDYRGLCSFLGERGVSAVKWVENGLSQQENQELFYSESGNTIIDLICRGLENVFRG